MDREYVLDAAAHAQRGRNYWVAVNMAGTVCGRGDDLAAILETVDCRNTTLYCVFAPAVEEAIAAARAGVKKIVYALSLMLVRADGQLPIVRRNDHAAQHVLRHYRYKWQD